MAAPVEVQIILCDAAVADPNGKLHMLGAGWSLTASPTSPHAVALLIKVPWDRTNQKLPLTLELLDADGNSVLLQDGPIEVRAEIEVGRPVGVPVGIMLDSAFTVGLGPLPLPVGRYQWRADLDGQLFSAFFTVLEPS
jgi:uncharacterized protein DUF6941